MNIYIDITRAIDWHRKAVSYYAIPHWSIDEEDIISPKKMDMITKKIGEMLNNELSTIEDEEVNGNV